MIDFLMSIGGAIMQPLYYLVSALLVGWHWVFSQIFPSGSGAAWVLSIVGLTVTVRAALIPLFVKQIKSSRNMQLIQPKVKALQKKYGHDRERLAQETMKLYKETGTNPLASCLPLLVQMPIFLALFRMLDQAARKDKAHGFLTKGLAEDFSQAKLFGVPIKLTFLQSDGYLSVQITAAILVVAMIATSYLTQRQLMSKNMPADALSGPYAQQQKMLLYVLPLVFAIGGIAFPLGVLIYWVVSNLWTMAQQFYVIRANPAPGTPAMEAKLERDRAKAEKRGEPAPVTGTTEAADDVEVDSTDPEALPPTHRPQPKRQTRSQRQGGKTNKK